jgi:hypothetical protein
LQIPSDIFISEFIQPSTALHFPQKFLFGRMYSVFAMFVTQVSHPYRCTGVAMTLKNFNFVFYRVSFFNVPLIVLPAYYPERLMFPLYIVIMFIAYIASPIFGILILQIIINIIIFWETRYLSTNYLNH